MTDPMHARDLRAGYDDRYGWAEALYADMDVEDRWNDPDTNDSIVWADEGDNT